MVEEPSLPKLPPASPDEHSHGGSLNPRKRVRPPMTNDAPPLGYNSSDPAIFSSDDDPALDNYVEGRRKKRYIGSWFQQHPTSSDSTFSETIHVPKQRRAWTRQADSGVFFGSDGNESDDMLDQLEFPTKPKLPQLDRRPMRPVSTLELMARDKIRSCLEQGVETIDFWSLGLESISNDTISPLSQFSCIPVVTKDVAFEQKEPELKLYLGLNRLARVPGAIFDLTYLTILSLRNNKLTELPPAIAKLQNLQDLNLSQNRLRYLPVELLKLFESGSKLHRIALHPNPFFRPEELDEGDAQVSSSPLPSWPLFFEYDEEPGELPTLVSKSLGRSPLQLSNSMGRVLSEFRLPTDPGEHTLPIFRGQVSDDGSQSSVVSSSPKAPLAQSLVKSTAVPSLLEVALRACYRSNLLPEMIHYIPEALSTLRQLLDLANTQKQAGGLTCSCCERMHVVSTVEWVEWREIGTCRWSPDREGLRVGPLGLAEEDVAVPFLHRGCSWRCGPREVARTWGVPRGYVKPSRVIIHNDGHNMV